MTTQRFFLLCAVALAMALQPSVVSARELSFDERVHAQRAIEQVYWSHRIWPNENPRPKPPLSGVMSDEVIRAKVDDYLRKSDALQTFWHRPITGAQLQAEMDRMATNTHAPQVLRELFAALGNDAFVIAETLARQTLADRLIRSCYANDARIHADVRAKAEAGLAGCAVADCMRSLDGEYRQSIVRRDAEDEKEQLDDLASRLGAPGDAIPTGQLTRLEETPASFIVRAVLSQRAGEATIASVTWPKRALESWLSVALPSRPPNARGTSASYVVPAIPTTQCVNDTWMPTSTGAGVPVGGSGHAAVWTGSEMIVWGGSGLNTGGRYDPALDAWRATSVGSSVPSGRYGPTAVWTGTEMIVWGGQASSLYLGDGGRYDPGSDAWSSIAAGPIGRVSHTAVWTGTEMIVWGGQSDSVSVTRTGGRYDPSSDTWTATSMPNIGGLIDHTAVWTGTKMIVWGGMTCTGRPDCIELGGSGYDPSTDTWATMSTAGSVPGARRRHTAVWTGSEMIVWGGFYFANGIFTYFNTGGRYDPNTNFWLPTSTAFNVPSGRYGHSAVWTGTEMIVWGGYPAPGSGGNYLSTGGGYAPASNSWAAISTTNAPTARMDHVAVWSGSEMIVWGGTPTTSSGGRFCFCVSEPHVFRDADGDGFGDPAVSVLSNCDGSHQSGFVDNAADCDDTRAAVHPNAVEINDGIDNQCSGEPGFGVIDEISGVSGFLTMGDKTKFSWDPQQYASSYDVVRSPIADFSAGCTTFSSTSPFIVDTASPPAASGFYYLVRPSVSLVGSWGQKGNGSPRTGGCLP